MKKTSKSLALSILFKPAILALLYGLATRIADFTGCRLSVLDPLADGVSELTGMTCANSAALVIVIIGFAAINLLSAAFSAVGASGHR